MLELVLARLGMGEVCQMPKIREKQGQKQGQGAEMSLKKEANGLEIRANVLKSEDCKEIAQRESNGKCIAYYEKVLRRRLLLDLHV